MYIHMSAVFKLLGGRVGRTVYVTTDPKYSTLHFSYNLYSTAKSNKGVALACFVMLANLQFPWTGLGLKSPAVVLELADKAKVPTHY